MKRLVQADRASPWESEPSQVTPTSLCDLIEVDTSIPKLGHGLVEVIAHQEQLVFDTGVAGMHGHFCGWKLEDQPTTPCVDVRVLEHIPEELAIGVGI
jgi:hypothetical protein